MNDESTPHLRQVLAVRGREADDDESGLPEVGAEGYVPHARPSPKPVFALHVIFPNGTVQSFQYQHLDSSTRYLHQCLELRFLGARVTHLIVRGRNLWKLYDYLHQHRVSWLRIADRDLAADGETIITGVSIEEPTIPGFDLAITEVETVA